MLPISSTHCNIFSALISMDDLDLTKPLVQWGYPEVL